MKNIYYLIQKLTFIKINSKKWIKMQTFQSALFIAKYVDEKKLKYQIKKNPRSLGYIQISFLFLPPEMRNQKRNS